MLDTILDSAVVAAVAAAIPLGLFLKRAIVPVVIAFGAGVQLGKLRERRETGRHARDSAAAR